MKIKDLIRALNYLDPTGEAEVCLEDNSDIIDFRPVSPGYYDGTFTKIECKNYKPVKITYGGHFTKIKLNAMDMEEAILNNPDVEWDDSTMNTGDPFTNTAIQNRKREYRNKIETYRAKGRILKKKRTEISIETITFAPTTKKLNVTWSPVSGSITTSPQGKKV